MASTTEALGWFLSQSPSLDLKINTYSWISEALPGYFDVHISSSYRENTLHGVGADLSADIAMLKAAAEVLERRIMIEGGYQNSSGFAAHLDGAEACANARAELVERDRFLCHFLTNTPFSVLDFADDGPSWLKGARAWVHARKLRLRFFDLGPGGALCAIDGLEAGTFGYIVATAVRATVTDAARSAFIEAARQTMIALTHGAPTVWTLDQFLDLTNPDFVDHGRLALDSNYARQIDHLFAPTRAIASGRRYSTVEDVDATVLQFADQSLDNGPFRCARAHSFAIQSMFLGVTRPAHVNLGRLSEFAGRPFSWSDVQHLPHPFN